MGHPDTPHVHNYDTTPSFPQQRSRKSPRKAKRDRERAVKHANSKSKSSDESQVKDEPSAEKVDDQISLIYHWVDSGHVVNVVISLDLWNAQPLWNSYHTIYFLGAVVILGPTSKLPL